MTYKPLKLVSSSTSYTSFDLQPPRTPGRRSFPSVQFLTKPISVFLVTIVGQYAHRSEAIYLIHPPLEKLALRPEKAPKYIIEKTGSLQPTVAIPPAATTIIISTSTVAAAASKAKTTRVE